MTIETSDYATDSVAVPTPTEAVTAAVHAWVAGLDIAVQGAEFVVDTPGCPDSFWPLPPGVAVKDIPGRNPKLQLPNEDRESYLTRRGIAARTMGYVVRYGLGLGIPPEIAVTGIFLIGGRPAMLAEQMVALVKERGHKHRIVERGTDRCVVEVRRSGETDWQTFEFTMADAERAGYVPGKGPNTGQASWKGNAKYNTDPAAMLYARASSIACKTVFPDVLRGMTTYEDAQDERSRDVIQGTASDTPARPRTSAAEILAGETPPSGPSEPSTPDAHNPASSQVSEPDSATSAPPEPGQPGETFEQITRAQSTKLAAVFGDLGVKGRPDRLVISAALAGLPDGVTISSSNDLTKRQASTLIDRLEQLAGKPEADRAAALGFLLEGTSGAGEHVTDDDQMLLGGAEARGEEA